MPLTPQQQADFNANSAAAAAKNNAAAINPPTPPAPTTSDTSTGRYPSTTTPTETPITSAEEKYQTDTTPEDPSAIASRIQSEYASEIQSIQNYYAGLTATQKETNINESGKTRALESASGELGQDIGAAETNQQDTTNQAALDKITQEEQVAEGAVTGQEATETESEIQSEKTTSQNADTQRLSFLQSQATQAQQQMSSIASTTDLASLPQDEYDSLYAASGFATPEQFNTYYNALRQSSVLGAKTIGDATTGVYQQQSDGTYKKIIPGTKNTIGDPTTGVWQLNSDGTSYTNVIPAQPKISSIGAQGSLIYNPTTGSVQTIAPATKKIVSSGGVIYAVDPSTNAVTQLTTTKNGWAGATGSAGDQEKAGILGYLNSPKAGNIDVQATIAKIQSDPTTFYQALSAAADAGFFTPINLGSAGTNSDNTDMTDAATNASLNDSGGGSTDTSQ